MVMGGRRSVLGLRFLFPGPDGRSWPWVDSDARCSEEDDGDGEEEEEELGPRDWGEEALPFAADVLVFAAEFARCDDDAVDDGDGWAGGGGDKRRFGGRLTRAEPGLRSNKVEDGPLEGAVAAVVASCDLDEEAVLAEEEGRCGMIGR